MAFVATNLPSTRIRRPGGEQQQPGSHRKVCLYGQDLWFRSVEDDGGRHLDSRILESVYRHIGDPPVDELLEHVHVTQKSPVGDDQDVVQLLLEKEQEPQPTAGSSSAYTKFYRRYSQVPSWVNVDALKRGQQIYLAYSPSISLGLFYRSLIPGFSIPKIAAVLLSTGYLAPPASPQQVENRLLDTGVFLALAVTESDLLPGSKAWETTLHVRFLHAKVRRALLRRQRKNRNDDHDQTDEKKRTWNIEKWGIPINQEDMAATLLAFSYNALLGCEFILGRPLSKQERLDYLHLWRYLGWLLGVDCCEDDDDNDIPKADDDDDFSNKHHNTYRPLDPCGPGWIPDDPDPLAHSQAMFGSFLLHLVHPDETSVRIAKHLLGMGHKEGNKEKEMWYYYRTLQCRRFVGDKMADALQLPLHPVWYKRWRLWTYSTWFLWTMRIYTWLTRVPWFKPWFIRFHRRSFLAFLEKRNAENKKKKGCPFALVAPPKYQVSQYLRIFLSLSASPGT